VPVLQPVASRKCGLGLQEFAEERGRLIRFVPAEHPGAETRLHC
jgi:hypothetical protein